MKNYISEAENLQLTAPYNTASGAGALVGGIFGVAVTTVASGSAGVFATEGEYALAKDSSVFAVGDPVYWDNSGKTVTSTSTGNRRIGVATGAALTGGATVNVKLIGTPVPRFFASAEQTGNGSAQNVAHGLGVVPSAVFIIPTDTSVSTAGVYAAVEGTHTSTNCVATVTSGKKYKVLAIVY